MYDNCKDSIYTDPKLVLGSYVKGPNNKICRAGVFKNQVNSKRKMIQPRVNRLTEIQPPISFSSNKLSSLIQKVSFLLSIVFIGHSSKPPFLHAFFFVIYCALDIIFTTHVQVGFGGFLSVPSNTFQNLQLVAVRLVHHYSGITSTLMRSESWLRGN